MNVMDEITKVAHGRPPFLSLYLGVDLAHEDGRKRLEIEWKDTRPALEAQGAPDDILPTADDLLDGATDSGVLALVRDADGQGVQHTLPRGPKQVVARFAVMPVLGPLIEWVHSTPPHLVVLVDRVGADLIAVVRGEREGVGEAVTSTEPVHTPKPGGWSQRKYQQRAQNEWEANAAEVAKEVAQLARSIHAEIVVVAGDPKALQLLEDHAPADLRPLLHVSEHGSRAAGADETKLATEVDHVVADLAARKVVAQLEGFAQLRGRDEPHADGPGETFRALRQALVDVLLVHDDPDDDRTAWVSVAAPTLVAMEARTLEDLGVEPVEARLVDIAIWSTLGSGGTVVLVPEHGPNAPIDGVGARLRGEVNLTLEQA